MSEAVIRAPGVRRRSNPLPLVLVFWSALTLADIGLLAEALPTAACDARAGEAALRVSAAHERLTARRSALARSANQELISLDTEVIGRKR